LSPGAVGPLETLRTRVSELIIEQTSLDGLRVDQRLGVCVDDLVVACLEYPGMKQEGSNLRDALWDLVARVLLGEDALPPRRIRLATLPTLGIDRVLWTIVDESDVRGLAAAIEPGQVWVRMDRIKKPQLPLVWSLAQMGRDTLGIPERPPGRPAGPRRLTKAEERVKARCQPTMARRDLYGLAVAEDLYLKDPDANRRDGDYADYAATGFYPRNYRRVKALAAKLGISLTR